MAATDPDPLLELSAGWGIWRRSALRGAGMPFDWLKALGVTEHGGQADGGQADGGAGRFLTEDRFLEALAWQNPDVTRNWVGRHAAALREGRELHRGGKRDALLARYAQRYCAKNDTIGFFGPVAWARFDERATGLTQRGSGGIRSRSTHIETWALEALAQAWSEDERLAPQLPVRLHPAVHFDGTAIRRPWRPPEPAGPLTAALLAAVAAHPVAGAALAAAADASGCPPHEVAAEFGRMRRTGVLDAGFTVPLDAFPERRLREQLDAIPDAAVRRAPLEQLQELTRRRAEVAAAAGDPVGTHEAIEEFHRYLGEAAGRSASRQKRQTLYGRSAIYQDSRRDLDVTIGGDLVDALRAPLALLLDSARWLAAEAAQAVGEQVRARYRVLCQRTPDVRLSELYLGVADVLAGAPGTVIDEVSEDFRLRWAELLATARPSAGSPGPGLAGPGPADRGEVRIDTAEAGPLAAALFPPRRPAWSGARYHSPDLMLARGGSGEHGRWVLGELHVALNTLESRVFHTQADDPRELSRAVAADMAEGRVIALQPNDSPEVTPRTYPPLAVHVPGAYAYWSFGRDAGAPAGARSWPATALRVREQDGDLVVEPPDGSWSASVTEALGEFLTALVVNRFQIRPKDAHGPRVLLDDLVICRESWRVPVARLVGLRGAGQLAAELRARGVPRHVFARTPAELKPFYVDLDAPLLVRNLQRALRLAAALPQEDVCLDLGEMLPGPDDLWIPDAYDGLCTAEFRLVAVDATKPRPVVMTVEGEAR
ncbi:lantibiotic dehydratase [Kitasatospora sp. NPDC008050]|uniref:lantibiotic dehydratase n=1 Tax=Kitasatospora sp. NPDC008050 TaxID=3364021 RepID=UPI0036E6ADEF